MNNLMEQKGVNYKQKIQDEIVAHINKEGSGFKNWYVGITGDINERLFGYHKVPKENAWYIYQKASCSKDAREIENFIIDNYGTQGGCGGGNDDCCYIYAYRITTTTIE